MGKQRLIRLKMKLKMWSDNGLEMSFWVKKLQLFEHVLLVTKLRDELQEVMHVEWHGGCFGKYLCSGSIYLMKKQLIHLLLNMYRWITGLCLFVIPLSHTLNMWWMLRLVVSVAASLSFSFIPASLSLRHMCKLEHDTVEEFTLLNTCCYCVSV